MINSREVKGLFRTALAELGLEPPSREATGWTMARWIAASLIEHVIPPEEGARRLWSANVRQGGRPRKVDDADAAKARQLREKGIAASDIAKMLGVSRATVYRYLSDGVPLSA